MAEVKISISDAYGNDVTVEVPDCDFGKAERFTKRLYDHIRATPTLGPAGAAQSISMRWTDPAWSDFRDGDHLEVKA